jgi:hypothetical protein
MTTEDQKKVAAEAEKVAKAALEKRGEAVGFNPDARKSVEDMTADVEAAEKEAHDSASETLREQANKAAADKKKKDAAAIKALKRKGDTHVVIVDSLTSMRGIKVKGQSCQAADFAGGEDQIKSMIDNKLIKKG